MSGGEKLLVLSGALGKASASIRCGEGKTFLALKCPRTIQGAFAHIVQNILGSDDIRLITAGLENGHAVFDYALNELAAVYVSSEGKVLLSGAYRGNRVDDGAVRRKIFYEHGRLCDNDAAEPNESAGAKADISIEASEPVTPVSEPHECRSAVVSDILRRAEELFERSEQHIGDERVHPPLSVPPVVTYKLLDSRSAPTERHGDEGCNASSALRAQDGRPHGIGDSRDVFNPFPDIFPRSVWRRVDYPGTDKHYYEGEAVKDDMRLFIQAIPGDRTNIPSKKSGFRRFARDSCGRGYWLKIHRMQRE